MAQPDSRFYEELPRVNDFDLLARPECFVPLPEDWVVGCTDIVDSSGLIADGQYRTVNMISAAVITAMINTLSQQSFPYVFAGDGASFAVPRAFEQEARATLARLRAWVDREFSITLRAAMLPVKWIRDEGYDVSVARYAVGPDADYAMFNGGGLAWAEQQMKQGGFEVPAAVEAEPPDLTGLSCRWNNMKSRNGVILSLLILPSDHTRHQDFAMIADEVLAISGELARNGHPVPETGPDLGFPTEGFRAEARLLRREAPTLVASFTLALRTVMAWIIFNFRLKVRGFDPEHYRRILSRNADYRKFDDGLKMTLDCSPEIRDRLLERLKAARMDGLIRFGWHEQDEAVLTCIVPSAFSDDHIHFVDGASGGYTEAARNLS